jgi:hypothetical protein
MEGRAFQSGQKLWKNNLVDGKFNLLNTKTVGLNDFVDPTLVTPIFFASRGKAMIRRPSASARCRQKLFRFS